jgi:predicted glutamine amidotransferase
MASPLTTAGGQNYSTNATWITLPRVCRLFGSRSLARGGVSHELFHGANALRVQSREHPDGWGVGWYEDGVPRVVRSLTPAHGDADFEKVSQFVSAQTVVAHVRKASVGRVAEENTHPFQRGPWLFAHNGTIPHWERVRAPLEALVDPSLRKELRGETDSERCFLLFLSRLRRHCDAERADVGSAAAALAETVALVREIAEHGGDKTSTTFLATDGRLLLACRRGRTLFLSSPAPNRHGECGYVAIASEDPGEPPPGGERAWRLLQEESLVAVDERLRLRVTSLLPQ